jgi:oxygen-independent coproporphyrinogen-3 oxidase
MKKRALPGIYVHIPFCIQKCAYCDFYSVEGTKYAPAYLAALAREMEAVRRAHPGLAAGTVYLGGGTPSILAPPLVGQVLENLRKCFDLSACAETTLECNPGTVTPDKARAWRDMGVDRVSLGVQSFLDGELEFLGRSHTAAETDEAMEALLAAGFDNFNLDLIFGIPGQTIQDFTQSLKQAAAFDPPHLSVYGLTLEKGTPLYRRFRRGGFARANDEIYEAMFLTAHAFLEGRGYVHYEVSNHALPGRQSKHNTDAWQGGDYFGFGCGAHSKQGKVRWANRADLRAYLNNPAERAFEQRLCAREARMERLMLGLRTRSGLCVRPEAPQEQIARLKARKLVDQTGDRIFLTASGMLLLDEIILLLEGEKCLT